MGIPEDRVQNWIEMESSDRKHAELFGKIFPQWAWESAVSKAMSILKQFNEGSLDEVNVHHAIRNDLTFISQECTMSTMDYWVVVDEAKRRMSGNTPRGPPGKLLKGAMNPDEELTIIMPHGQVIVTAREYYSPPLTVYGGGD